MRRAVVNTTGFTSISTSRTSMKIVTLNIQHGGGQRVSKILDYISSLQADLVVLTEYRENANAPVFRSKLAAQGFVNFATASIAPKENSVGIFSRLPIVSRTYPMLTEGNVHRVLSAHFEEHSVFGIYFPQNQAQADLFNFLIDGTLKPKESAYLVVGDFNTGRHGIDEAGSTFHCAEHFSALSTGGLVDSWRTRNPDAREFSWHSNAGNGFRIDHAFASAVADSKIRRVYYDHTPRSSSISDHSALVIEYAG